MPTLNLTNIIIKKLADKNFNTYYLIVNNDNLDENRVSAKQVYFCFERTVKEGWNSLVNNWETIQEVEIEYTEINKIINSAEQKEINFKNYRQVVSFYSPQTEEFIV